MKYQQFKLISDVAFTMAAAVILAAMWTASALADDGLPDPGMEIVPGRTALVVTDPQNDFLSPDGVTWGVVGKNVTANRTVQNIDALFAAARAVDMPVFISPHYYYPHDHRWQIEGALEALMHSLGMFDRPDALSVEGFEGSGADWLPRYKKKHQRRANGRNQPAQGVRPRDQ